MRGIYTFFPTDVIENDESVQVIREQGFIVYSKTNKTYEEMNDFYMQTIFLKSLELIQLEDDQEFKHFEKEKKIVLEPSPVKIPQIQVQEIKENHPIHTQSIICCECSKA